MSTAGTIPQWTRGDRLYKALEHAGMTVEEMAAYLGVSRATIANWKAGRTPMTISTVRDWAARTGVPYSWLELGEEPGTKKAPQPVGAEGQSESFLSESNRRPFHYNATIAEMMKCLRPQLLAYRQAKAARLAARNRNIRFHLAELSAM